MNGINVVKPQIIPPGTDENNQSIVSLGFLTLYRRYTIEIVK
jgi:hypothetical protein